MVLPPSGPERDEFLAGLPEGPAVFVLRLRQGDRSYVGRTALLGRRVRRLLSPGLFGAVATGLEYWPVASRLASSLQLYEVAKEHYPDSYLKLIKLRMPAYVRVLLSNEFPRTAVTNRLSRTGLFYGPFRSRVAAEAFEVSVLEHFQIRRCAEELAPSPEHPGCMYGEMNQCLRPCQAVVSAGEYRSEVRRLTDFLASSGRSLAEVTEAARDRFSAEMEFEEAARQHQRLDKIAATWRLRDELAATLDEAHGIAVTPALTAQAVELRLLIAGAWQPVEEIALTAEAAADKPVSLDRRLRERLERPMPAERSLAERQEHLALLARWGYSSWRDGEWLPVEDWSRIPYRRLVNMVHRVATSERP
jgi:excinuclease ABC subunit C